MKKISALVVMIGCLVLSCNAFAGGSAPNFVGIWTGDYCTMNSKEGLSCGKPAEIVIDEQQKGLVRGHLTIKDKDYPLSGIVNASHMIDYADTLGSIGCLSLSAGKVMHMRALNRCVGGDAQCAHQGTFKRK